MPKLVDPVAQRREICGAARRVFAGRGVAGTGLTHVAAAIGMGRSSLYHYYPDKAALLGDLVNQLLEEEEALYVGVLGGPGSPRERLERLARAQIALFEEWAATARVLFDMRLRDAARFAPFFRRIRDGLARLVREGQQLGEFDRALVPELAAATLIGAVDGLLLQHCVDPRAFPDLEALAEALAGAFHKALAP